MNEINTKPLDGIKVETIARTIVLLVALVNQVIAQMGIMPLNVDEATVYEAVSVIFTIGAAVWAWWKNNSFTKKAIEADKVLHGE